MWSISIGKTWLFGDELSDGFRTSSFHRKYSYAIALRTTNMLASTRIPTVGLGQAQHDLDRNPVGGAGRRTACLFPDPGNVFLDQPLRLKTFRNPIEKATESAVLAANHPQRWR
jgi:hypothetical protein